MLHTKFRGNRPAGSREEGFLRVFTIYEAPGVWGNRGTRAFNSGEQGNKGQFFQGNSGTKTIYFRGKREQVHPPGVGGPHIWAWWPSWSCDKPLAPIFHFPAPENFHTKFGSEQHSSF